MNQLHECLDLLRQLVAIPSQSQNEEEHARFIAAYLEDQLGMETELSLGAQEIKTLRADPSTGKVEECLITEL